MCVMLKVCPITSHVVIITEFQSQARHNYTKLVYITVKYIYTAIIPYMEPCVVYKTLDLAEWAKARSQIWHSFIFLLFLCFKYLYIV